MYTLAEIRALGAIIKNETRRFFNTGARIDEVIQAIIDHINGIENEGLLIHNKLGGRDSADCHPISSIINLQNIIDEKNDYRQIGGEDLDGICQTVHIGAKNGNYGVRLENNFHGQNDLYLEVLDINQDKTILDSYYIHKVYLKDGGIYSRTAHFYEGHFLEFTTDWIKEGLLSHSDLTGKNAEPEFQHVTQEEKTGFHTHNNKEYLDNYNPTLFATALQGEKADSALQSLPPNTVIDADYPTLKDKLNGIEENANNYEHPLQHSTTILSGVSSIVGSIDRYLNQRGDFTKPIIIHSDLTDKNAETTFQHIDTTTTKETLVVADKVAILDSATGKVVLTDKSNVGGGGSTDIISSNVTNNTGTIVIDTTPNWQRVNISGGGSTLILDYANGILPTKNREYLLVINNASATVITLTLPTVSFVKGGITYNFKNTAGSVPIDINRSIEVNVIFFFIDATTCNIRTQISQFI